jgi:hypothetical protein
VIHFLFNIQFCCIYRQIHSKRSPVLITRRTEINDDDALFILFIMIYKKSFKLKMKCSTYQTCKKFCSICTIILRVDFPSISHVLIFKVIYIHEKSIKIYKIKNLSNHPCINLWVQFFSPRNSFCQITIHPLQQ